MIVLTFLAVLCICSSMAENKTFYDGAMSFNYPGYFNTHSIELNSSQMQAVTYFTSDNLFNKQYIDLSKNKTTITSDELKDSGVSSIKNLSTAKILSITTETNSNGIVIDKVIFLDEKYGDQTIHNLMYFKINDTVYGLGVYGPYSNRDRITDTSNAIFQSLK